MRRLAFFLFLAAAEAAWPQSSATIQGTVSLRADKSRLHHATVLLVQLKRSVQTGDDGRFQFQNVPPGKYDLIAHMHAMTDDRKTVSVAAGETAEVDFNLSLAAIRQEITVTASGQEESTIETFQTVTSLNSQELIHRASSTSLGDLLDHETGIAKRSFGPGTTRPVVRGFDGDRVLVLSDGARSGTLSSQSGDHGEPVDPTAVERVEVVRGPATLLYGSNAIGGVVNVLSTHHTLDNHPHDGLRGNLTTVGSTNNWQGGGSGNIEYGLADWLLWLGGGGMRVGDYKTPLGHVTNSRTDLKHGNAGVGHYGERASFTLNYMRQSGLYGVPFAAQFEADAEPGERVDLAWKRDAVRFYGAFNGLGPAIDSFGLTLNYSDWNHDEIAGGEIGTRFSNNQFTANGVFRQRQRGVFSGSFGLWSLHRDYKAVGEEALTPPATQNAFALFGVEEFSFERLRLQAGIRLENNRYAAQRLGDRSFTGVSAALGARIPLWTNGALVANYTHSYRAPAIEELYNNGPHIGNLAFELGNPGLRRERGNGIELALRHQSSRFRAELNTFYYRFRDFIFLAPTGEIEDGLREAEYLQAPARYLGAEARVDTVLRPFLNLNLGFDAVDAQLRQSHTPLPRIPPVRGRIGLDFHNNSGLSVRPELILSNAQHQLFPTEDRTAGYALWNLSGSYTVARQHVLHVFSASLFNVADRLYRNHLSLIKEFAPEIGRGLRLSYTLNFY